jgi:hypothetical protein
MKNIIGTRVCGKVVCRGAVVMFLGFMKDPLNSVRKEGLSCSPISDEA